MTTDLAGWLTVARRQLASACEQPLLEAQLLAAAQLGRSRSWVAAHGEFPLTLRDKTHLNGWLTQRKQGTPLPYLLNRWEFYGLAFSVTPDVLIPRPESEQIVEWALDWLKSHPHGQRMVDVGTGSGCIAAAIAANHPKINLIACDRSLAALRVARKNFRIHHLEDRIFSLASDLLSALTGPFDLICANLPYIPTEDLKALDVARHEPSMALDGGADGLDLIDRLLAQAVGCLAPEGRILLEIEYRQGSSAQKRARHYFPNAQVTLHKDSSGLTRYLIIDA